MNLASLELPVPPAKEQLRIASKIDELFSDLDAGVAALERAKANLKRYRASVLKAAVEGRLTAVNGESHAFAPENWRPISEAVVSLEQGWSPKCERENSDDVNEWVVIKTTAIQPLQYLDNENKRLPSTLEPRANLELQVGDLLITRAGPRIRAGVACMVRSTRPRVILCDKAYRIRLDNEKLEPGYAETVLNAPPILDALDDMKTGISDSGVNLTQNRFLQLRIPIPSLDNQRAIEEAARRMLSQADAAESQIDASIKRAARLRQSILKRAFAGRLVPQDPHDEPASALLERIAPSTQSTGKTHLPSFTKREHK